MPRSGTLEARSSGVEAITAGKRRLGDGRPRKWASAQAVRNVCVKPLDDVKPFDLFLGIKCDAVYHAGQVQLIKRLRKT
jgi:hypothetical protein